MFRFVLHFVLFQNDLNYAVCFEKLPGYCGIVYSNVAEGGMEYNFELLNAECGMYEKYIFKVIKNKYRTNENMYVSLSS